MEKTPLEFGQALNLTGDRRLSVLDSVLGAALRAYQSLDPKYDRNQLLSDVPPFVAS
jgi:hypothetical protein